MSQWLRLPLVMLLIDTSSVYGRELIEGIGRYAAEHGPWSIYHEDRGLFDPLPPLLKRWQGDGIVARSVRKTDLKRLDESDLIRWLDSLPKPCGVFCACDVYAIQVTNACRRRDIAVPTQIAVLGVDNDPVVCSVSFPPLSSVDLNSKRVDYEAAALLDRMMGGNLLDHAGFRGLDHHAHGGRIADHARPGGHSARQQRRQPAGGVRVRSPVGLRRADVRTGLAVAVFGGIMSASMALAFTAGKPIAAESVYAGTQVLPGPDQRPDVVRAILRLRNRRHEDGRIQLRQLEHFHGVDHHLQQHVGAAALSQRRDARAGCGEASGAAR